MTVPTERFVARDRRRVDLRGSGRAAVLVLVTTLLVLGVPNATAVPSTPSGAPDPASSRPVHAPAVPGESNSVSPSSSFGLPGSRPDGEPPIDAPALSNRLHSSENLSELFPSATNAQSSDTRRDSSATGRTATPILEAGIRPAATPNVTGVVVDARTHSPIPSANVTAASLSGATCPGGCPTTTTDAAGRFAVPAPAGADSVSVDAAFYLPNATWVTVAASGTTNAGTINLTHYGYVTGVLQGDDPAHEPVSQANVSVLARNASLAVPPPTGSTANGSFRVAVPPLPAQLVFTAYNYLENWTYVNVTPYATRDLGVVYLERGVLVTVRLVDSVTLQPVPNTTVAAIQGCSRISDGCFPQSPRAFVTGPVEGYVPPGPTFLHVFATGFVVNTTPLGNLSRQAPGAPLDLGTVDLVPEGAIRVSSNLTGGPPQGPWTVGAVGVVACSLDNLDLGAVGFVNMTETPCDGGYVNYSAVGAIPAPPLRDYVEFVPWAQPGGFPVSVDSSGANAPLVPWNNESWVNVTPDRLLVCSNGESAACSSTHNLTGGGYVAGSVFLPGTTRPPPQFDVQACSTIETDQCGADVLNGTGSVIPGCPTTSGSFCVPAPPGPDRIRVSAPGASDNFTWFTVPRNCCVTNETPIDVGVIHVSAPSTGRISGSAFETDLSGRSRNLSLPNTATFSVCPVGTNASTGCVEGAVAANGSFTANVSDGWNEVAISDGGLQPNETWNDVVGANSTGTIYLNPDAYLAGRIVGPDGRGLVGVGVNFCPLGSPYRCVPLGTGATGTNGLYDGPVPPGPFPGFSYRITASATGFTSNSTWVNSSEGTVTFVPTIELQSLGGSGTPVPARSAQDRTTGSGPLGGAAPSQGAWVIGRLVDNSTGFGIPYGAVELCSVVGTGCSVLDVTSSGGEFNGSAMAGGYWVETGLRGYYPSRTFVNVTSSGVVTVGTILVSAYGWFAGRILIDPWPGMGRFDGNAAAGEYGLSASGTVAIGCDAAGANCGAPGIVSSGGFFNVSAPYGGADRIGFLGGATGGPGTAPGGFHGNNTTVNLVRYAAPYSGGISAYLPIFAGYSGTAWVQNLSDPTVGSSAAPVRWGGDSVLFSHGTILAREDLSGGGHYVFLVPAATVAPELLLAGDGFTPQNRTALPAVAPGEIRAVASVALPPNGWIEARVTDRTSAAPIADALLNASVLDSANRTTVVFLGRTNGAGQVNLSIRAGSASILVGATDYVHRSATAGVSPERTTFLNWSLARNFTGSRPSPFALIQSAQVGGPGAPPTPTVVDPRTAVAIPGAYVRVTTPSGVTLDPNLQTNALGQFLALATPGADLLVVRLPGYVSNLTSWNVTSGARIVIPRLNLTGMAVLAGRVDAHPGGAPIGGATVMVCPLGTPACADTTVTNGSGGFWIVAPPGTDQVTASADGFLDNSSLVVTVRSDAFVPVGAIGLDAFGTISGVVLGLPDGTALAEANASVCSTLGSPVGPCFLSVATNSTGRFELPMPPGTFVLQVSFPGYNTSRLPFSLAPGARDDLGVVFLEADGTLDGRVVNATSGLPVANASVTACPSWVGGTCAPVATTGIPGTFAIAGAAGPYLVEASATGYVPNSTSATIVSATATRVRDILLFPQGPNSPVPVSGTVVGTTNPSSAPVALAGATVSALVGGTVVAATLTNGSGDFVLELFWGTYALVVSASGYQAESVGLEVLGPVANLSVVLPIMTYPVSGTIRDGTDGAPIAGATIWENDGLLAKTSSDGTFAVRFPNGTYVLEARATPPSGPGYLPERFAIDVNGAGVDRDVLLYPRSVTVFGDVVQARTGLPVPGARVTILNFSGPPTPIWNGAASAVGTFAAAVPLGIYRLNVSAPGYIESSTALPVGRNATNVIVTLQFAPPAALGGGSLEPWALTALGAGGAVVAVLVGILLARYRSHHRPPPSPLWGGSSVAPLDAEIVSPGNNGFEEPPRDSG